MSRTVEVLAELEWEEARRVGFRDGTFSLEHRRRRRSQLVAFSVELPAGDNVSLRLLGLRGVQFVEPESPSGP